MMALKRLKRRVGAEGVKYEEIPVHLDLGYLNTFFLRPYSLADIK